MLQGHGNRAAIAALYCSGVGAVVVLVLLLQSVVAVVDVDGEVGAGEGLAAAQPGAQHADRPGGQGGEEANG